MSFYYRGVADYGVRLVWGVWPIVAVDTSRLIKYELGLKLEESKVIGLID